MGKQRNIKIVEEMKKRREKGNFGSLDVSPQRTDSQPAKTFAARWLSANVQRTWDENETLRF